MSAVRSSTVAASLVILVLMAGCSGSSDPLELPQADSAPGSGGTSTTAATPTETISSPTAGLTSVPTDGPASSTPTQEPSTSASTPTVSTSSSDTAPTESASPPEEGGKDDNVSIGPTFQSPKVSFGSVPVGASKTLRIGLSNDTDRTGSGDPGKPFTISSVTVSGNGFALTDDPCSGVRLEVGAECVVNVTFHPTAKGEYDGVLSVATSPAISGNKSAQLLGTGGFQSPPGPTPGTPTAATQKPTPTPTGAPTATVLPPTAGATAS